MRKKMKTRFVNIKISEEAHSRAKILCVLKGITLNDYLSKAIEEEVEKDKGMLAKIK
jgi:predicted HicB family RNase H-like nuclease